MPPIRRAKRGQHTLAYWYHLPSPPRPTKHGRRADGSVRCEMVAEEDCALGEHETRNIVCCAKHHEEVPCGTCGEGSKVEGAGTKMVGAAAREDGGTMVGTEEKT